jgi:hypothetical protein
MPPQKKSSLLPPPRPADLVLMFDRVALEVAVLVDERGHHLTLPLDRLPRNPRPAPGDVIRVPLGEARRPLWHAATVERAVERHSR